MSTNELLLRAIAAERGGDLRLAEALYRQALALDPANAEYHHALGTLHQAQGDIQAASACFERALALDPSHAAACLCLADALMDTHDYDRALATYRRALTMRRPFPEAHHNLA